MGGGEPSLSQKARVPFTQMFQLRLPFEKGATVQHFFLFFIFWLRNSHNDAFLKFMKSELFGCPYNFVGGGGENSHM